jgi:DNA-binding NarL/FixJ family response regulator
LLADPYLPLDLGSGRARGELVGRQDELRALEAALARPTGGASSWIALGGDPGVGKTRLLSELVVGAGRRGHLVLGGRGTELERGLPFGIWVDALDDHVGSLCSEEVARLAGRHADELARVLPSVPAGDEARRDALQDERYRAHRAVRSLLERMAARRPLVVVLDDLHWADDASLELVAHLLRRPMQGPVLLAVAFRAGQLPPWLAGALDAGARDGLVTSIAVRPLSSAQSDALLGEGLGAGVRARLYELTGGNPFYLEQLAGIAARDPGAFMADDELASVPESVAAALRQQVAGLSDNARLLAWGAAVAGEPVDLQLAAATAGIDEQLALQAVDELLDARLLLPAGVPCRYRFRHPIVRRAVYEAAGDAWRMQGHARASAALAARGGSMSARAHHVEQFAGVGDEHAVSVLVEAGRDALARAPAGAVRWFRAALRLLPEDQSGAPRRLELLIPIAVALVAAGSLEQGLSALLDALALVPAAAGAVRARLIGACARCENLLGRHDAAHARLLRALTELADQDSPDAAALHVELAADAIFDCDFAAALEWAERGGMIARASGEPGLTAVAAALASFATYTLGRPQPAELARVQAVTALDSIGDDVLASHLDAPYYLGYAEYFCERYDDAIRHLQRGIDVSRASGQGQFLVPMTIGLAFALEVRGRLAEARLHADGAVEASRLAGNPQVRAWALVADAWTAAMSGDHEQAIRAGEEALTSIAGLDESVLSRATRDTAMAAFIEAGDPERGLRCARSAGAPDFRHADPGRRSWLYAVLAQAELARGRLSDAEAWLVRGERTVEGLDLPLRTAAIMHSRALLLLADGRPHDAADTARRAIGCAETVGAILQAARSRTLLGTALGQSGRREEAVELLRQAEAKLASCGAQRLRAEAARELRRLGRRPTARQRRSSGGEGLDALSGREREIANLVAQGHTNRMIAAQLFVSDKTIESHLTNVFSKLRVVSRAQVAERIGRTRSEPT